MWLDQGDDVLALRIDLVPDAGTGDALGLGNPSTTFISDRVRGFGLLDTMRVV